MKKILLLICSLLPLSCDEPASVPGDAPAKPAKPMAAGERMPKRPATRAAAETTGNPVENLNAEFAKAQAMENPAAREKALAQIAWNAIEVAPELAHQAFHSLPASSAERLRLIHHYAMRLAESDTDEAMRWADSLATAEETAAAKSHIALTLAEADPVRAATMLSECGLAGRDFDVVLVEVIQRWAAVSPKEAAGWVSAFDAGPARYAGIKTVVGNWLLKDHAAAFTWYDSLKDAQVRTEAARAFKCSILAQNQEVCDRWLGSASPRIKAELDQQHTNAVNEMGDDIPRGKP